MERRRPRWRRLLHAWMLLLAGGVAALVLIALDPGCRGPGDSGGCAMGIPVFAIGAGFIGGAGGILWALVRSIRRR